MEVADDDILAFFVWIPRYRYAIPSGSGPREISAVFEDIDTPKSTGEAVDDDYLTHPAFTFGDDELNGFWAGKFISTGTMPHATIRPLETILVGHWVSTLWQAAYYMNSTGNIHGLVEDDNDTHMMKNTERGAVTLLSQTQYGKMGIAGDGEVWKNNHNGYMTGYVGNIIYGPFSSDPADVNPYYDPVVGGNASTSGTIYGVYDMAGATYEYVMGNYEGHTGCSSTFGHSGFNGTYSHAAGSYSGGIDFPDPKYYDLYSSTVQSIKGDASSADGVNGWYNDWADYDWPHPWVTRGGRAVYGTTSGIFAYEAYCGQGTYSGQSVFSFRIVLAPF